MARFRRKPIELEGVQWFKLGDHPAVLEAPQMPNPECEHCGKRWKDHGWIKTLEGGQIVCPGDWVMTGVKGEHYPCKPDIFPQIYEAVEEKAEFPRLLSCTCRCSDLKLYAPDSLGFVVECQNCGLKTGQYMTAETAANAWNEGVTD